MHTLIYVMKRKPGMSLEQFLAHYRDVHGPLVRANLPGIVSYMHYPIRETTKGDLHAAAPEYDAVSIYTFASSEAAEAAWNAPTAAVVQEDSAKFLDFDTLITLPVDVRQVV